MSIAALIRNMSAAGAPAEAIALAVEAIEAAQAQVEQTRAVARERKRKQRAKERGEDVTVTGQSRDTDVTVTDNLPLSPPSPNPPQTPQEPQPPLTPTRVIVAPTREADPVEEIVTAWNTMAERSGLKTIRSVTAERRGRVKARLAEHGRDAFTEAIAAVERSPFCRGDSDRGWRADFDFLLQPKSFNRLIEGSYDRAPANNNPLRRGPDPNHPGSTLSAAASVFGGMAR